MYFLKIKLTFKRVSFETICHSSHKNHQKYCHEQLINELSQQTVLKTIIHTFDRQPNRTTSTEHNKQYDVTNPIMSVDKYCENT